MLSNLKLRWAIIATVILGSLYYLYPSIRTYTFDPDQRAKLEEENPNELKDLEEKSIKLGLDLQGGMHLVLELENPNIPEDEAKDAINRALEIIRNRVDQFGVAEPLVQKVGDQRIIVELPGIEDEERAMKLVKQTAFLEFKIVQSADKLSKVLRDLDKLLAESADTTQAVAGSETAEETEEPIAEQLFTTEEEDTLETITNDRPFSSLIATIPGTSILTVSEENEAPMKKFLSDPKVQEVIPFDSEFAWGPETNLNSSEKYREFYLLEKEPQMTGEYIADAHATLGSGYDPQVANKPIVLMELTSDGGKRFEKITAAHVQEQLAIVLDAVVKSAPRIQNRIPAGSGAQITGIGQMVEAKDLAIVLRAGALPAPLQVIEERTVGPSLGADSIRKGKQAFVIGLISVVVFMVFYYKFAGLIANTALVLDLIIVMAVLAGFGATLTLPGIAGLILTIGMAVDANVLIFERIREELKTGKTIRTAIDAGYDRAFKTILDANVTTFITAVVLFQFGTGPIKGFAVTLSVGLIASMFTAIFVTRSIFDLYTLRRSARSLNI